MTKTTKILVGSAAATTRTDENGKRLYIIWPDGYVWIYEKGSEQRTLELTETGEFYRFNNEINRWVEANTT